jgi:hypothetical protein
MKTLFVSLAALVAVSNAALASERGDLRDSDTHSGKYATQNKAKTYATDSNALVIVKSKNGRANLTAFERMNLISEENEHGDKH